MSGGRESGKGRRAVEKMQDIRKDGLDPHRKIGELNRGLNSMYVLIALPVLSSYKALPRTSFQVSPHIISPTLFYIEIAEPSTDRSF